ncbi:hypothetical protein H8356DRAFT_1372091 [Neocallimastix lanati (nom. inval.)]|uniref:Uncharacterized protein n=1 Tax=Neocallimastix californiae TaxID=1754190 RepID=A0A1Y2DMJ8_9FUNG|nr:hypothetical protein H8356DRAFT_1372091 [Neocallimastix sp. JGI-2020a]ORY60356.1 hypothetical protein LY90DRAFT_505877 [Neocallimastix californiae]|eukprot:ORY60356.1 hypothetical protein LY90DRAFT_505877 [Neocallimastix californiae]
MVEVFEENMKEFYKELNGKCNPDKLLEIAKRGIYLYEPLLKYEKIKNHVYVVDISMMAGQYFMINNIKKIKSIEIDYNYINFKLNENNNNINNFKLSSGNIYEEYSNRSVLCNGDKYYNNYDFFENLLKNPSYIFEFKIYDIFSYDMPRINDKIFMGYNCDYYNSLHELIMKIPNKIFKEYLI